jgi:hypothetical protein
MNWIETDKQKPADGQECITRMKHGFISGQYCEEDNTFCGYYWRDMEWWAQQWMPIEWMDAD